MLAGCGVRVAAGDDVERPGASVLKLFLVVAVHVLAARGEVDLDQERRRHRPTAERVAVVPRRPRCGHRFTVAELAGLVAGDGRQPCGGRARRPRRPRAVAAVARDLGCQRTALRVGFGDEVLDERGRANTTTAADSERILARIAADPALAALRPALRTTLFTGRIQLRLPGERRGAPTRQAPCGAS